MAETEVALQWTMTETLVLSKAYHWDMRPYTSMIHQGRSTEKPSKLDSVPTGNLSMLC